MLDSISVIARGFDAPEVDLVINYDIIFIRMQIQAPRLR